MHLKRKMGWHRLQDMEVWRNENSLSGCSLYGIISALFVEYLALCSKLLRCRLWKRNGNPACGEWGPRDVGVWFVCGDGGGCVIRHRGCSCLHAHGVSRYSEVAQIREINEREKEGAIRRWRYASGSPFICARMV